MKWVGLFFLMFTLSLHSMGKKPIACVNSAPSVGAQLLRILGDRAIHDTSLVHSVAHDLLQQNPEITSSAFARSYRTSLPRNLIRAIWRQVNNERPIIFGDREWSIEHCIHLLRANEAEVDKILLIGGTQLLREQLVNYVAKRAGRQVFKSLIAPGHEDERCMRDNDEQMCKMYYAQGKQITLAQKLHGSAVLFVAKHISRDEGTRRVVSYLEGTSATSGCSAATLASLPALLVYYDGLRVTAWQEPLVQYFFPRVCPGIIVIGGDNFSHVMPFLQKIGEILRLGIVDHTFELFVPRSEKSRADVMHKFLLKNGINSVFGVVYEIARNTQEYTVHSLREIIDGACINAALTRTGRMNPFHIQRAFTVVQQQMGRHAMPPH